MNCQDISRIVDSGSISGLSGAEHSAAESHARSCRDCAAIWGVQSRLAGVRIPAMPPQVAVRFRALASLPDLPIRGRVPRRLMVVGSLVAMAAAAALLTVYQTGTHVAEAPESAAVPAVVETVPPPAVAEVAEPATTPAAPIALASREPDKPVPLLPPPNLGGMPAGAALTGPGLQKAIERHPELIEGPEIDGTFVVGIALRSDGSVHSSAVRHVPSGSSTAEASAEINAMTPGMGGITGMLHPKSTPLTKGQKLRAAVLLTVTSIPDGFDITRSRTRVMEILGNKYAHLMAPLNNGELNRLEVFLSEDGTILRERMDVVRSGDSGTGVSADPESIARFAEGFSARLGLDVGQIGVVGATGMSQGPLSTFNRGGGPPVAENPPRLLINYAWVRRAGESAPTLGTAPVPQGINEAAALAVVERYIPDAFTARDPAAGQLTLLLSAKGEFIRAGRMPPSAPQQSVMKMVQERLGDASVNRISGVKLRNAAGVTIDVIIAWTKPTTETANPAN